MCVCVSVCTLLTTILMTVAGTKQSSPGTQQRTVTMNVPTTLVTKAYLGSLVEISVVLASVCCVATMGCWGCARTTSGCGCVRGKGSESVSDQSSLPFIPSLLTAGLPSSVSLHCRQGHPMVVGTSNPLSYHGLVFTNIFYQLVSCLCIT